MITVSQMLIVLQGKKALIGKGNHAREIGSADLHLAVDSLAVGKNGAIVLMVKEQRHG